MQNNRRLSRAAQTYWRLLLADPWPTFAKQAPRAGHAAEALTVRREAEEAFGRESFERALIREKPE